MKRFAEYSECDKIREKKQKKQRRNNNCTKIQINHFKNNKGSKKREKKGYQPPRWRQNTCRVQPIFGNIKEAPDALSAFAFAKAFLFSSPLHRQSSSYLSNTAVDASIVLHIAFGLSFISPFLKKVSPSESESESESDSWLPFRPLLVIGYFFSPISPNPPSPLHSPDVFGLIPLSASS